MDNKSINLWSFVILTFWVKIGINEIMIMMIIIIIIIIIIITIRYARIREIKFG